MNEHTRPLALLTYANTVALGGAAIYFNNRTNAINTKLEDVTEEVSEIREGVEKKVPMIENSIKSLDQMVRNIAGALNGMGAGIRKGEKSKKKLDKLVSVIEAMGEAIESLETQNAELVAALKAKGSLETSFSAESTPTKTVKAKKNKKAIKYETDSSDSESEEEIPKHKHKSSKKSKSKMSNDDSDDDEVSRVVKMASRR